MIIHSRTIIAFIVLVMAQFVMTALLFVPVPTDNKEIYYVGIGNIWAAANLILGYYFTRNPKE